MHVLCIYGLWKYAVLLLPLYGLVADAQLHAGEKMDRGARQDNLRWFTVIHVEQALSLLRAFSSQPPLIQAQRHARTFHSPAYQQPWPRWDKGEGLFKMRGGGWESSNGGPE